MRSTIPIPNPATPTAPSPWRPSRWTSVLCLLISGFCLRPAAASTSADRVPLFFAENAGQASAPVRFVAQGSGGSAWFSPGEVAFRAGNALVRIVAIGSNSSATIEGVGRLSASANFLIGPETDWRLGVRLYRSVVYRDLYPGIDMVYDSEGNNLKSQYFVQPGADPAMIRLAYVGAASPVVEESGSLTVSINGDLLQEEAPRIYQVRGIRRDPVEGRFAVSADGTVHFVLGRYDASLPLIIDPTMAYSTLLGGSSSNSATAVAVDSTGDAYIAGFTASQNFPTASPEQNFNAGSNDVFVAKFNANGNGLVYCTYLGGSADDRAYALAVDASGDVLVAGYTNSYNFPLHTPLQSSLRGARNAFVAKLGPAGNTLVFSTYLGGNGSDTANGLAVDPSGNAYVVGDSTSTNFPATNYQKANHGSQNAFAVKISPTGSSLIYSTYLGGNSIDHGAAIAVDAAGSAYITGSTYSTTFPVTSGAYQAHLGGGQDAFLAKLSADGNTLAYGTFFGGSGGGAGYPEGGQGIAVDAQGNVYIAGSTSSTNFPVLGGVQASLDGWIDAFAAKFGPSGTLVYSTYLGGSGIDIGNAIAVDSSGGAYLAGYTASTDLPVTGSALQATSGGSYDAFLARLNPAGNALLYLSYLGGSGSDTASGLALDRSGNAYVAGWTLSPNFPVLNGYQSISTSNYAAFLAKFSLTGTPPTNVGVTPSSGSGFTQTFAFQVSDVYGAADLSSVSVLFNGSISTTAACAITFNQAANTLILLTDAGSPPSGTITPGSGSQQNSQCTLSGAGSSVTLSGNLLTLNLSITFQSAFTGSKNIYLQASNPLAANSWQQMGTWTVPAAAIHVTDVAPAAGSGSAQTFAFTYSDTKGYAAINNTMIVIGSSLAMSNVCYIYFFRPTNLLYLANDAGSAWQGPITAGQSGILSNSQCTLSASGSSSGGSGNNLTLNVALTFLPAFAGARNIWTDAADGVLDTNWLQVGTFAVVAGAQLGLVSVTPTSGTGSAQTFTVAYSDSKGYADIVSSTILVNNSLSTANGCYISFNRANSSLSLSNDAGNTWQGPIAIGQNSNLSNSQCTLSGAGSSVSGSGNNLTLNVALAFLPAFAGARNFYAEVTNGSLDTGWIQLGTYSVLALAVTSLTPNSGSGASQTFSFAMYDSKGYATIANAQIVIGGSLAAANTCFIYFNRPSNNLYLANDAGTTWMGPITIGQSGNLQNSQCTLSAAGSSAIGAGDTLTLSVALSFPSAFAGTKSVWMDANDGSLDTNWLKLGTWTVPGS